MFLSNIKLKNRILFHSLSCKSITDCKILFNTRYTLCLEGSARKDTVVDLCRDSALSHNERGFTHWMRTCKPIYPLNSSLM